MQPSALVTGAAGFLGAHLVRELGRQGRCRIVGLDDLSGGSRDNLPDDAEFINGSVNDVDLLANLFERHRFRYVYHLAAYAAEGLSHFIRRFNYTNNLVGSINLLNEAVKHDADCFVFTSSIAVYGAAQVPMHEDMVPVPEDPYGIAKYAVELDLKAAQRMFGLDYVVFRPHNVYGEYQNVGDRYRNVVGIFMNQILRGEPMTVFGNGEQQRAFSYVGEIVGAIAQAPWVPAARNRVFNVGADQPCTVNQLARAVAEAMGVPGHPIVHVEPRDEVKIAYCDHEAARQVFGSPPRVSLEEGLARMAAWVRHRGAQRGAGYGALEVAKGLPPRWLADGA